MRSVCLLMVVTTAIVLSNTRPASAVVQFYKVFAKEYLDTHPDKEFAAAAKKSSARCYLCHVGKKRTHRNAFGEELAKYLDKKKDAKDTAKISEALKKALAAHVDPNDESSETYADRLAASKWPSGDLETNKKEPAEETTAEK